MEFVHRRIVAERDNGAAVIVVSTELDEVLGLADRIGVMYRGKIIGELSAGAGSRRDRAADGGHRRRDHQEGGLVSDQTVDPAADTAGRLAVSEELDQQPGGWGAGSEPTASWSPSWPFVTAMLIGGVLIAVADPKTQAASHYFFQHPWDTFTYGFHAMWNGYTALFEGAIFNIHTASKGTLAGYLNPISETLTIATPLILARPRRRRWPSGPACSTSAARARSSWGPSVPASSASTGPPARAPPAARASSRGSSAAPPGAASRGCSRPRPVPTR